jgi:hypothetical protein
MERDEGGAILQTQLLPKLRQQLLPEFSMQRRETMEYLEE